MEEQIIPEAEIISEVPTPEVVAEPVVEVAPEQPVEAPVAEEVTPVTE